MTKPVLWLASWYPSRIDSFSGDFIERQAIAVSEHMPLTVLAVLKDETLASGKVETEITVNGNLTVYRVYYGNAFTIGWIEKLLSLRKYLQLQKQLFQQISAENGQPGLVHVHVAMKAGLLALFLKKKYRIPFIVTEHWTGYYKQSVPSVFTSNGLFRNLNKKILQNCSLLIPVSADLGKTINRDFVTVKYQVIPNVVDTALFNFQPKHSGRFRFIHPSYLNFQKNPEGILAACLLLKQKGVDFEMVFIGAQPSSLIEWVNSHDLTDHVYFKQAVPYRVVAEEMQQSSALLLFSRFENLPCVILEALCCGLPVISSKVGGIAEVINDQNGILVNAENISELALAMESMITNYSSYDNSAISNKACAQFAYNAVGLQYARLYAGLD